jgi:kojibiose phosphorylase
MREKELIIDNNWCVVEQVFDLDTNQHFEAILGLGTGYLSSRSNLDEGLYDDDQSVEYYRFMVNTTLEEIPTQKSRWGTFMPVIGAKHPFLNVGVVNLPYYLGLVLEADDEKLDMEMSTVDDYHRWLNMKTATLYRTLTWRTKSGKVIDVAFKRYMDPKLRFVCVQECRLKMVSGSSDIHVTSFVDNNVRTNGWEKFTETAVGNERDFVFSDVTTNMAMRIITASKAVNTKTTAYNVQAKERRIGTTSSFRLAEGEEVEIKKVSVVVSDQYFEQEKLVETALKIVHRNLETDSETLYENHVSRWTEYWDRADVVIVADDDKDYDSQHAMRMAIYHLLRGKAADEDRGLVCPKGMLSEVYYGGTFWDMEIFVNPFYIYNDPVASRNTPMFRYRNLPEARKLARQYGYGGAKYPWVSSFDGKEVVVLWEYADHQIHIVGDVVIGLWHYYQATNDIDFMFDYGAEVIVETARYWLDRVDVIPGLRGYQIYGVTGPDEYKPLVNNNAYTNYGAKFNLELAYDVLEMMKEQVPEKYKILASRLSLEESEIKQFRKVSEGINIPMDKERNIVWQCDNFETAFAPIDVDAIWKDKTQLFGKFISQERTFRSKTAKQADVVALFSVFPSAFTQEQKETSFDYYLPFTIHDSTCSMVQHIHVAADIGRPEKAYEFWKRAIDIDFGRYPKSANGPHFPNVGGMWQDVVFGFSGLQSALNTDILTFKPCLPKQITKISYKIHWKLNWVRITVTDQELSLQNLSYNSLPFIVNGKEYLLEVGIEKTVKYS